MSIRWENIKPLKDSQNNFKYNGLENSGLSNGTLGNCKP